MKLPLVTLLMIVVLVGIFYFGVSLQTKPDDSAHDRRQKFPGDTHALFHGKHGHNDDDDAGDAFHARSYNAGASDGDDDDDDEDDDEAENDEAENADDDVVVAKLAKRDEDNDAGAKKAKKSGVAKRLRSKITIDKKAPASASSPLEPYKTITGNEARETQRQKEVKAELLHAYRSYEKVCFGQDELLPRTNSCGNWIGLGLTIVDSLDVLYITGCTAEYERARAWVADKLNPASAKGMISFFETVIRVFGGLLSAYDLSGDKMFLDKAQDVGARLGRAFDTPTGLPRAQVSLSSGRIANPGWTGGSSILAEVATVQLEFMYLSRHTKDEQWAKKALRVIDHLDKLKKPLPGLYPMFLSSDSGAFTNDHISFGAMGDSAYEYFLKMWLLTGRKNKQHLRMYVESADGMIDHLLQTNDASGTFERRRIVCLSPLFSLL
jgi:hypothetical protein